MADGTSRALAYGRESQGADEVLRAGQILHRELGEVLHVAPAPRGAPARVGQAVGVRASRRSIRRELGCPRDHELDERLRRLGVGRR